MFQLPRGSCCLKPCGKGERSRNQKHLEEQFLNPLGMRPEPLLVIFDQGKSIDTVEFLAAAKEAQLDGEGSADDLASQFANQFDRRRCGPTGRQQVVTDQRMLAGSDAVLVNLESVGAVFELIRDARSFPW